MRTYDKLIATIQDRQSTGGLRSSFGVSVDTTPAMQVTG
jgi:hypothetical protein